MIKSSPTPTESSSRTGSNQTVAQSAIGLWCNLSKADIRKAIERRRGPNGGSSVAFAHQCDGQSHKVRHTLGQLATTGYRQDLISAYANLRGSDRVALSTPNGGPRASASPNACLSAYINYTRCDHSPSISRAKPSHSVALNVGQPGRGRNGARHDLHWARRNGNEGGSSVAQLARNRDRA